MDTLKEILINRRKELSLKMREVSAMTKIDQGLLSKIERGVRLPTEDQLKAISAAYSLDLQNLMKHWLAEKVFKEIKEYPEIAAEALLLAEPRVEYLSGPNVLDTIVLSDLVLQKLSVIDRLQQQWQTLRPMDKGQVAKMQEFYAINYTAESNQIEGNTLTARETEMVVNKGITITGKSVAEHLEAINHSHAIEMIYELIDGKSTYDKRTLLDLHGLILRGIDQKNAGQYRNIQVMISGSSHLPPQPYLVDKMMEDYFIHYTNQQYRLHPVILAAEMHERLVSIHPFVDGNGRTSRLIMNLILLQHGYTVTSLKGDYESRMRYYSALEKVQVDNDPESFYLLVLEALEESLKSHLKWVDV